MKKLSNKLYFLLWLLIPLSCSGKSYVSYSGSGGRLGDCLVAFLHAAQVSYWHNLELVYNHFNYFDQLALSRIYRPLNEIHKLRPKIKTFAPHESLNISKEDNVLYIIPYFPAGDYDRIHCNCFKFDCDWNNKEFLNIIRSAIKPHIAFPAPTLEENKINVAVHIRRGGGADAPLYNRVPPPGAYADTGYPMKFPPVKYYSDQLKKIIQLCAPASIHVHLFTDDTDPGSLIARIKAELTYDAIDFTCRTHGNYHNRNVLEDLFTMPHFDILLRGDSNYAVVAEKLADYLLVISPVDYKWQDEILIITKQKIRLNSAHKKYQRLAIDQLWLSSNFALIERVSM